jgi:hypothetical protein
MNFANAFNFYLDYLESVSAKEYRKNLLYIGVLSLMLATASSSVFDYCVMVAFFVGNYVLLVTLNHARELQAVDDSMYTTQHREIVVNSVLYWFLMVAICDTIGGESIVISIGLCLTSLGVTWLFTKEYDYVVF